MCETAGVIEWLIFITMCNCIISFECKHHKVENTVKVGLESRYCSLALREQVGLLKPDADILTCRMLNCAVQKLKFYNSNFFKIYWYEIYTGQQTVH